MSKDLAARYFKENKTSFFFKKKKGLWKVQDLPEKENWSSQLLVCWVAAGNFVIVSDEFEIWSHKDLEDQSRR